MLNIYIIFIDFCKKYVKIFDFLIIIWYYVCVSLVKGIYGRVTIPRNYPSFLARIFRFYALIYIPIFLQF